MKVHIVEASHPEDFFDQSLDGVSVHHLLNTIGIKSKLRMVLDLSHLKRAITEAVQRNYDVLHVSCHGDTDGIELPNYDGLSWAEFSNLFPTKERAPILVMSTCCGAVDGISDAFRKLRYPPNFIFGSQSKLQFDTYSTAWAILYRRLNRNGISQESGRLALKHIRAVAHGSFIYRRWDQGKRRYRHFPSPDVEYNVVRKWSAAK